MQASKGFQDGLPLSEKFLARAMDYAARGRDYYGWLGCAKIAAYLEADKCPGFGRAQRYARRANGLPWPLNDNRADRREGRARI